MSKILVSGGLVPTTKDTLLDARTRVATFADIANIENPARFMVITVEDTGKKYEVRKLASKIIGGIVVENSTININDPEALVDLGLAEELRSEDEKVRQSNEKKRIEAENLRKSAEDSRKVNENSRISSENSRVESERTRVSSEETRNANEQTRNSNESKRQSQESTRQNQESARQTNESTRNATESARKEAESERKTEETSRRTAELSRSSAENTRVKNEQNRTTAENTRSSAEDRRVANETQRTTNETARNNAELSREQAEGNRASTFNTLKGQMQTTIQEGQTAVAATEKATSDAQKVVDNYDAKVAEQDSKLSELGSEVDELNTLKKSSNLVDFDKVTSYAYLDTKGGLVESQYADWRVSDFIKVKKGDTIIANASKVYAYIAVYDYNKNHVRNTDGKSYQYEEGDSYIRITFNGNKESCRANYGESLLPYEPYYKKTVKDAIRENKDNITELYNKIDSVNSEIENSNIFEESSNLVDFSKVTSYAYLGADGSLQSSQYANWVVSDFIEVNKGDVISTNASKVGVYIAVYDTNKNHVRNTDDKIYRYEDGDSYIRITFNGSKTACHANYGETLLPYEPYYKTSVKDAISDNKDNTIELFKLTDNICKGVDLSAIYGFHQWGDENLVGVCLNVHLTELSDGNYMTTTYVPIAKGVYKLEYSSIGDCAVVIYDKFKDKLLAWDNNKYKLDGFSTSGGTFNAPEGSCYIRICCYRNNSISLIPQISTGNNEIFRVNKGKKLVTIGDSITQQKSWQKKLSVFQGFQWDSNETDFGVGVHYEDADGNRYAEYAEGLIEIKNAPMGLAGTGIRPVYVTEQPNESSPTWVNGNKGCSIYDRAKDAQFYNPDVIILWPCANDFSTVNVPELLGTIEDEPYIGNSVKVNYMSEPNGITIYSSLKGTLQILSSTCPNARIVVLGLMPWMIYSLDDYERYMSMEEKMNKVIEECCKLYNIQYVDMFSIGCNFWNQQAYYTKTSNPNEEGHDTSDRQVHPNDEGCLKIAEYLSSFF